MFCMIPIACGYNKYCKVITSEEAFALKSGKNRMYTLWLDTIKEQAKTNCPYSSIKLTALSSN